MLVWFLPYLHRAEFCQILISFGQWSFKKNCFWDLLTFRLCRNPVQYFIEISRLIPIIFVPCHLLQCLIIRTNFLGSVIVLFSHYHLAVFSQINLIDVFWWFAHNWHDIEHKNLRQKFLFYSCHKISKTWIQISRKNWNVFFSNIT